MANFITDKLARMGFVRTNPSNGKVITAQGEKSLVLGEINEVTGGNEFSAGGVAIGGIQQNPSKTNKAIKFFTGQLQTAAAPTFSTHTWHVTAGMESHFDAVQLIVQNEATAGFTLGGAAVGVKASVSTNNVTPDAWIPVTFSGSASVAIPARIAAGVPSITLSDVISISSVDPTDGAYPYLMMRTYCAVGGYSVTGAAAAMAHAPQHMGRYFVSYRDGTGDYATTNQAAFTKGSAQNLTQITGVVLYCRGAVVNVLGIGDSITQGAGISGSDQYGFGTRACASLSTVASPVIWSNFGFASQTTDVYFQRLQQLIAADLIPQVLVYAAGSGNSTPSNTAKNMWGNRLRQTLEICRQNMIVPILYPVIPNTTFGWSASADNIRKQFNAEVLVLRQNGCRVSDLASLMGDGATPERMNATYTTDNTHPNDAGHQAMANVLAPMISAIQRISLLQ